MRLGRLINSIALMAHLTHLLYILIRLFLLPYRYLSIQRHVNSDLFDSYLNGNPLSLCEVLIQDEGKISIDQIKRGICNRILFKRLFWSCVENLKDLPKSTSTYVKRDILLYLIMNYQDNTHSARRPRTSR